MADKTLLSDDISSCESLCFPLITVIAQMLNQEPPPPPIRLLGPFRQFRHRLALLSVRCRREASRLAPDIDQLRGELSEIEKDLLQPTNPVSWSQSAARACHLLASAAELLDAMVNQEPPSDQTYPDLADPFPIKSTQTPASALFSTIPHLVRAGDVPPEDAEALRKAMERERRTDPECYVDLATPARNEPKIAYRLDAVHRVLDRLQAKRSKP